MGVSPDDRYRRENLAFEFEVDPGSSVAAIVGLHELVVPMLEDAGFYVAGGDWSGTLRGLKAKARRWDKAGLLSLMSTGYETFGDLGTGWYFSPYFFMSGRESHVVAGLVPRAAFEALGDDDVVELADRILGLMGSIQSGFITLAPNYWHFRHLGYAPRGSVAPYAVGYGARTALSAELVEHLGGEASIRAKFSGAVRSVGSDGPEQHLVLACSSMLPTRVELDELDALLAPVREARLGWAHGGSVDDLVALSTLDGLLVRPYGHDFGPGEVDFAPMEPSETWPAPERRPDLAWFEANPVVVDLPRAPALVPQRFRFFDEIGQDYSIEAVSSFDVAEPSAVLRSDEVMWWVPLMMLSGSHAPPEVFVRIEPSDVAAAIHYWESKSAEDVRFAASQGGFSEAPTAGVMTLYPEQMEELERSKNVVVEFLRQVQADGLGLRIRSDALHPTRNG